MRYLIIFLLSIPSILLAQDDPMFDICPLKIGEEIPEGIVLSSSDATEVSLEKILSDQPTVLIVYRGAWCGYCTKHLSELEASFGSIDSMGYQIIGVVPDAPENLKTSVDKTQVNFDLYSDAKLSLISSFGLDWKVDDEKFQKYKSEYKIDLEEWSGEVHHSLPVPAVYIIEEGVVEFSYVNPNYSKRLKVETLLAILGSL